MNVECDFYQIIVVDTYVFDGTIFRRVMGAVDHSVRRKEIRPMIYFIISFLGIYIVFLNNAQCEPFTMDGFYIKFP